MVKPGGKSVRLEYLGKSCPSIMEYHLEEGQYQVDVIDTWNMTIEDRGVHGPAFSVDMPSREYMAIRITKL